MSTFTLIKAQKDKEAQDNQKKNYVNKNIKDDSKNTEKDKNTKTVKK